MIANISSDYGSCWLRGSTWTPSVLDRFGSLISYSLGVVHMIRILFRIISIVRQNIVVCRIILSTFGGVVFKIFIAVLRRFVNVTRSRVILPFSSSELRRYPCSILGALEV
jgi:hypothetical protein